MNLSNDDDIVRGSGPVFHDLDLANADREQLPAFLAARIIGVLDERELTVQAAHELTGIDAKDFARIRQAKLDLFTIDKLMGVLSGLGQEVEVTVDVRPRETEPVVAEIRQ